MCRVLRPGGRALLFVPAFMFLWGVQDDVSHHRRRYTRQVLRTVVEQAAGFESRPLHLREHYFLCADSAWASVDAGDWFASRF